MAEAWDRLLSDSGLCAKGNIDGINPGNPYELETSTGDKMVGELHINKPPHDLCATVDNLNNAFLRVRIDDPYGSDPRKEVNLWLSTYDLPIEEINSLQKRWDEMMERLFAAAPTA